MGLAFVPLYIRYLGIEAYGLIGFFVALQAWMNVLDFGMGPTVNRELARRMHDPSQAQSSLNLLRSIEIVSFGAAAASASLLILAANFLATSWFNKQQLSADALYTSIVIMACVISIRLVEGVYRNALIGLQRYWIYNIQRVVYATITPIGAIAVLHYYGAKIEYFFTWQLLAICISVFIMRYFSYSELKKGGGKSQFSKQELKLVFKFASGMFGITLITLLLTQLDKLVLSKILTLEAFGYYALAASLSAALISLVSPVEQAIFPRLSSLYGRGELKSLTVLYHKAAQLVSVILGAFSVALVFFSNEILYLWTQDELVASNTSFILKFLAVGTLLNGLMWVPYKLQLASGWTSLAFRMNVAMVLVLVPLMLYVVPIYGGVGAALVWCLLNLIYVLVTIPIMHSRLLRSEMGSWYLKDVLQPILTVVVINIVFKFAVGFPDGFAMGMGFLTVLMLASVVLAVLSCNQLRIYLRKRLYVELN